MTNIKIFSDFACPFCYIGFSIADKLRKENPGIDIQWLPYILNPDTPLDGAHITDSVPQERIDSGYKQIEVLGKEYGLVYNNKTRVFNTNKLHKAALYSHKEGKYYEFAKEAFKVIFEDGLNVGDPLIINEIGLKVGLNIVEMNNCIESGQLDHYIREAQDLIPVYEVELVPTFIVDDKKKVGPLRDYKTFSKDLLG